MEFSREIVDVEVRSDGVTAVDATDERHEADVVVGADGHRSAVRRAVLDPAPATEIEWTTWQGLTPVLPELADGTTGVCFVGPAGQVGLLPSGEGLLMWWFDVDQPLDGPPAAVLARRFTGYGPLVQGLLEKIRDGDLESFRHVTHRIPDQWGRAGARLLGDAAHAFPPTQAQAPTRRSKMRGCSAVRCAATPPTCRARFAATRRYSALAAVLFLVSLVFFLIAMTDRRPD